MSKTQEEAVSFTVTMEITGDHEAELHDALDYLRERLLGPIPEVFTDFATEVSRTLWEGYSREGVVVRIVGDDGQPIPAPIQQTPEEIAREAAEIEAYANWMESPEGRTELDRDERFYEFTKAHEAETTALYRTWLESRAELFRKARRGWQRKRTADLKDQFHAHDTTQEEKHV
jgi:hypothetical protein